MEKKFVFLEKICRLWALKPRKTHINMLTWKCEWKGRKELPRSLISPFVPLQGNRFYIPCGGRIKTSVCPLLCFAIVYLPPLSQKALGLAVPTAAKTPFTKPPRRRASSLPLDACLVKKKRLDLGSSVSMPASDLPLLLISAPWACPLFSFHFISHFPFFSCAYLTHSLS